MLCTWDNTEGRNKTHQLVWFSFSNMVPQVSENKHASSHFIPSHIWTQIYLVIVSYKTTKWLFEKILSSFSVCLLSIRLSFSLFFFSSSFLSVGLWVEASFLQMTGKHFTNKLSPQPSQCCHVWGFYPYFVG